MIPEPSPDDLQRDAEKDYQPGLFTHASRPWIRRAVAAERERDRLAMMAREVTCVWCGHQFVTTLQSQAEELYEHAKVCEKHPVRKAETERDKWTYL